MGRFFRKASTIFGARIKNGLFIKKGVLLADLFGNFGIMCQLEPAKFLSAPEVAWQATFKKTEVELELITDIDMLLMIEKEIRGRICHSNNRDAKTNKNI